MIVLDHDISVKEMLKPYLLIIKKPELFGKIDKIIFLFKAESLKSNDKEKN